MIPSRKTILVAFMASLISVMPYVESGANGGGPRRLPPRARQSESLDLNGTFNGYVYYPDGKINTRATLKITGERFEVKQGKKTLLSGTISATLETMPVKGVPRKVSFGKMQVEGGPQIDLRPFRNGNFLKLLNRGGGGNPPVFRFCSQGLCKCRIEPMPLCPSQRRKKKRIIKRRATKPPGSVKLTESQPPEQTVSSGQPPPSLPAGRG
jgi:hypothetical protein